MVIEERCLSDSEYKTCRFYVTEGLPEETALGIEIERERRRAPERDIRLKPYMPIHGVGADIEIGCPEAVIEEVPEHPNIVTVFCRVLGRFINKYELELCVRYWKECPYKRYGRFGASSSTAP